MVKLKKFVSLLCTMVLLCSVFSFHTFVATEEVIETTENEGVNTLQPLEEVALHKVDSEEFDVVNLEDNINVETFEEEIDTSSINLMSRAAWRITQPVYKIIEKEVNQLSFLQ